MDHTLLPPARDTPYLAAPTGELWGTCCEKFATAYTYICNHACNYYLFMLFSFRLHRMPLFSDKSALTVVMLSNISQRSIQQYGGKHHRGACQISEQPQDTNLAASRPQEITKQDARRALKIGHRLKYESQPCQGMDMMQLIGCWYRGWHYNDVIVGAMVSQITNLTIIHSTAYSGAGQRKPQKLRLTGLCEGSSPVTGESPAQRASKHGKCFTPFGDVIMWTAFALQWRHI